MKYALKYSVVINILCDVIADVVDVNMKACTLTNEDRALIRALPVENGWGAPPNRPDLNPVDYSIWGAFQQLVYHRRLIQDVEHLKEVLQTCWEQIGHDVIDCAIGQFRKRLSLVVATGGGHIELVGWSRV